MFWQKQPLEVFYKKGVLKNFAVTEKQPYQSEKETLAQVFSCEFYEISKNTFLTEHLWKTTSEKQLFTDVLWTKVVVESCSIKKVFFIKILQNLQENNYVWSLQL